MVAKRPPSILMLFDAFPRLPSDVNLTSPPVMLTPPEKVLAVLVRFKVPVPFAFAANVIPPEPEITPPNVIAPPLPNVKVLLLAPSDITVENVKLAVLFAKGITVDDSPNCIFPLIIMLEYFPVKSLVPFEAMTPSFNVTEPGAALPPIAFTPLAIRVPAFKVNPPP